MIKPENIVTCCFCGDKDVVLLLANRKFSHENYINKNIQMWLYVCKNCKVRFTTTESDTISYNQLIKNIEKK